MSTKAYEELEKELGATPSISNILTEIRHCLNPRITSIEEWHSLTTPLSSEEDEEDCKMWLQKLKKARDESV